MRPLTKKMKILYSWMETGKKNQLGQYFHYIEWLAELNLLLITKIIKAYGLKLFRKIVAANEIVTVKN